MELKQKVKHILWNDAKDLYFEFSLPLNWFSSLIYEKLEKYFKS